MSKHKMMFYINKNNISKVMLFTILLVLTSEDRSSLSTELLSLVNKNSTIVCIYLMLQFKNDNELSYFYVQGAQ